MKGKTGLILTALCLLTVAAGTASAHGSHPPRDAYDRLYGHVHWEAPARSAHMPRWLRHDRHFLSWYRHSALRHDPYLPWWKVYRVYERHYALGYRDYRRDAYRDYRDRDDRRYRYAERYRDRDDDDDDSDRRRHKRR